MHPEDTLVFAISNAQGTKLTHAAVKRNKSASEFLENCGSVFGSTRDVVALIVWIYDAELCFTVCPVELSVGRSLWSVSTVYSSHGSAETHTLESQRGGLVWMAVVATSKKLPYKFKNSINISPRCSLASYFRSAPVASAESQATIPDR